MLIYLVKKCPFTLFPLILLNIFSEKRWDNWFEKSFPVQLPSGVTLEINFYHVALIIWMVILFGEILRAASNLDNALSDHLLSLFVFLTFLLEFLLVNRFGNYMFFMGTVFTFLDVIAGISISGLLHRQGGRLVLDERSS